MTFDRIASALAASSDIVLQSETTGRVAGTFTGGRERLPPAQRSNRIPAMNDLARNSETVRPRVT